MSIEGKFVGKGTAMTIKPVKTMPAPGYPDKYAEESKRALAAATPRRWIAAPLAAGLAATVALGLSGCERATLGEPTQTPVESETIDHTTLGEPVMLPVPEPGTAATTEYLTMGTIPAPTAPRTNPAPANVVVPLFEYGSGSGSIGCIRARCNHYCACLNRQATGSIDKISPMLCAHERIVLPIADRLAERLYKKGSALFIQKQYNEFYPLASLAEDRL